MSSLKSYNFQDAQVVVLEPNREGRGNVWTGTGYMRTFEGSQLEFEINDIKTPMKYDLAVRYSPQLPKGWDDVRVHVEGLEPLDPNGPCADTVSNYESYQLHLPVEGRSAQIPASLCLEPGKTYNVRLEFRKYDPVQETPSASVLIDSVS